ncbi:MAG TPA: hypothetical protein VGB15_10790 [Longimicrobium sp.]|jgi:hypothetical protein
MRKMKLDVERLAVESFAVGGDGDDGRGTIHGNAATRFCTLASGCAGDTCDLSCNGSCATGYNCQQVC